MSRFGSLAFPAKDALASWSIDSLSERLGVKKPALLGALISWNEEGVIEPFENPPLWVLVEEGDAFRPSSSEVPYSFPSFSNKSIVVSTSMAPTSKRGSSPQTGDTRDRQAWEVTCKSTS